MTEAIDDIWNDDLLDRRTDAEFLINFLLHRVEERAIEGQPKSYVLNIDAPWGYGKTYFLERLARHLAASGNLVAFVNAWRDDYAEDPLLAVMSAIDEVVAPLVSKDQKSKKLWNSIKQNGGKIAYAAVKGAVLHWARRAIGGGLEEALKELNSAADTSDLTAAETAVMSELSDIAGKQSGLLLADFRDSQIAIENFRTGLQKFLEQSKIVDKKPPMFVLVDELDRCRPAYAISLLERIKHLFEVDNVIFVVATNTRQLRHAIGAIYGAEFDSHKYLLRFFDRAYYFQEPELENFILYLLSKYRIEDREISVPPNIAINKYILEVIQYTGISLRDVEQCFDILKTIMTVWDFPVHIEIGFAFPLIVLHQQGELLDLNSEIVDKITEIGNRNNGNRNSWTITFPRTHSNREENISGLEIFRFFLSLSRSYLNEIVSENPSTPSAYWVHSRARDEFSIIHNNSHYPSNPPKSILTKYPNLIRSAGQLAQSV